MKLNSKYFDAIRIKPRQEQTGRKRGPRCQWKGCDAAAEHRAPKGRGRDGEFFVFCIEHVRQFNATYNYFEGMSSAEVEDFQKDAITGHRPTWKLGDNGSAPPGSDGSFGAHARYARYAAHRNADPHDFLEEDGRRKASEERAPRRGLRPLERKAFETMHLAESATKIEIKARFKELVKRHHPDSNGGDRDSEEKLREIIQAYNYLRQAGLV